MAMPHCAVVTFSLCVIQPNLLTLHPENSKMLWQTT
jgi:hypothetical protein